VFSWKVDVAAATGTSGNHLRVTLVALIVLQLRNDRFSKMIHKHKKRVNQGFERRSISRLANKKAANPFKSFTSTD